MNPREPAQTFEAARRQHLIDATIEALADVGFKAASLSQIAQRANVSTGLFAHYFGDKDGLLEATLRFMAVRLARAMRERLAVARNPRERLYAVPDSALADQEFDRRTSAVWLAFWGQITHSARYQRIQLIYQHRMISNLRHDLRRLVPADRVERYASMIASMIDGVWIRSHASDQQADAAKARALVRDLIDELIESAACEMSGQNEVAPGGRRGPPKPSRATPRRKIEAAVARADVALDVWRRTPARRRAQILWSVAEALERDAGALAMIEAREIGRAVSASLAHTLPRATRALQHAAASTCDPSVLRQESGAGAVLECRDDPLGIVALAGRWSSPLLDAVLHAAPALAAGNAFLYQAPQQSPGPALHLARMFEASGLPAGLFQTLEEADDALDTIRAHPAVATLRPESDKAATVILDDMEVGQAAEIVLRATSSWRSSPDTSETRILVARRAAPVFFEALVAAATKLRVGDPVDPATDLGDLPTERHAKLAAAAIDDALRRGAHLLLDGRKATGRRMGMSIVEGCDDPCAILRTPMHAPVIALSTFADDEELLARLRPSHELALTGLGILTRDEGRARRIAVGARVPFCAIESDAARSTAPIAFCAGRSDRVERYRRSCHILVTPE